MVQEASGEMISHYRVVRELGTGSVTTVYLAEDPESRRIAAVKVPSALLRSNGAVLERFKAAAEAAVRLRHPQLVTSQETGETAGGVPYVAMEFLEGRPLGDVIAGRGRLPLPLAVSLTEQIASALDYLHGQGITLGDLTLADIVVDEGGHVKVTDVGLSRSLDSTSAEGAASAIGNSSYRSPEQLQGEPLTPAVDSYALGVITYQMLAGRLPFIPEDARDGMRAKMTGTPQPVHEHAFGVFPEISEIVARQLANDPGKRFPSAAAFAGALREAMRSRGESDTLVAKADEEQTLVLPEDVERTLVYPSDEEKTLVLPGNEDQQDGEKTLVLPEDADRTAVLPADDEAFAVASGDSEVAVLPSEEEKSGVLASGVLTSGVLKSTIEAPVRLPLPLPLLAVAGTLLLIVLAVAAFLVIKPGKKPAHAVASKAIDAAANAANTIDAATTLCTPDFAGLNNIKPVAPVPVGPLVCADNFHGPDKADKGWIPATPVADLDVRYQDGSLLARELTAAKSARFSNPKESKPQSFLVEVRGAITGGGDRGTFGLTFRNADTGNSWVEISKKGCFDVVRNENGQSPTLAGDVSDGCMPSAAVHVGAANTVDVLVEEKLVQVYINGQSVANLPDEDPAFASQAGPQVFLRLFTGDLPATAVEFQSFRLWDLP